MRAVSPPLINKAQIQSRISVRPIFTHRPVGRNPSGPPENDFPAWLCRAAHDPNSSLPLPNTGDILSSISIVGGSVMYQLARGLVCFLIACSAVLAQTSTAQISGTVKDETGSAIPGAQVRATQAATGAVRSVVSGADGRYVLANLPVGPYTLEVTRDGFSLFVDPEIVLKVDAN